MDQYLTPQEIVKALDKYIIGQRAAKRNVAIALRNRWRRMHVSPAMQSDITPNNILMIGPTGVGKTEIARRLAKLADAPFVKVEASKFTEVGYVGRDVESMVRDLVEHAVNMVKAAKEEEVKEKAAQLVEDLILDALIPPVAKPSETKRDTTSMPTSEQEPSELNQQTRERFRLKIRSGELDDRKIEVNVSKPGGVGVGMIGGGMMDEAAMMNLQDMLSSMLPQKTRKKKLTIGEAKKLLLAEEANKLIDMDVVKEEALSKARNTGIIFIDEIDKIAAKAGQGGGVDVSREGVQRDLLPIVEGSAVSTKYGTVHTDHILFIAAGAFHVSKPSDLIPELQGRFPIRVELDNLTQIDFVSILTEPKNALTAQYRALFEAEGVAVSFDAEAIEAIATVAHQINETVENIGARRLHTVMSHLLNDFLYDVPDKIKPKEQIKITKALVTTCLAELAQRKDLSEYIL
ncbi:MAG: ATP-dependent protease ATPase subunit HslU [Amoebophilaceae bacterium]|jgi:ATP-dependent HslUV protease ATP-binding subunit HslU|nr:ATP-dependent protease ATPase subunit HslU [Amoebophilaceae bacterium]